MKMALSLLLLAAALPASAKDPLDLPARASSRAPTSLLVGLAAAGERLVAVGERGIVVRSDAKGANWSQAKVPVSVMLTAVSFFDATRGWAVGHDGVILSTTDGGANWLRRFDGNASNKLMLDDAKAGVEAAKTKGGKPLEDAENALGDIEAAAKFGPSRPLLGLWFRSAWQGYAVGAYGQAFRTDDGGVQWKSMGRVLTNPEGFHYNAIGGGADGQLAIAGEAGRVYRSADNGASWKTEDTGYKGHLYGVIYSGNALLAYGFGGHVFRSENGGPWTQLAKATDKSIVGGTAQDDGTLLLAAQDGSLLVSRDQGRSFALAKNGDGRPVAAMLVRGKTVALAGAGGVKMIELGTQQ
jgi:photosystem II stability/assembly factor-like uncharacterized protein